MLSMNLYNNLQKAPCQKLVFNTIKTRLHLSFHYSRAFALGVFKARNFAEMAMPRKTLDILCQEIQLHLNYCRQWEISELEIFQTPESAACISYTRYLLDCGMTGGLPELYAAVTPCALGYAQVARYITEKLSKTIKQSLSSMD